MPRRTGPRRRRVPIFDAIDIEVAKIRKHRQRQDLREVIERVSSYWVITSRVVIAEHEVEALLDRFVMFPGENETG